MFAVFDRYTARGPEVRVRATQLAASPAVSARRSDAAARRAQGLFTSPFDDCCFTEVCAAPSRRRARVGRSPAPRRC
jgi:hypothetical protein